MSERFCGIVLTGSTEIVVNAFHALATPHPLLLLQREANFAILAHGAGTEMKNYAQVARSLSTKIHPIAIVFSCSTSGHASYQLFEYGNCVMNEQYPENVDDTQMYHDIGISRSELHELFLSNFTPASVNPLDLYYAIELIQQHGWQEKEGISNFKRQAKLAYQLMEQYSYESALKTLDSLEQQLNSLKYNRHVWFIQAYIRYYQKAIAETM